MGKPSWRAGEEGCPGGRDIGRQVIEASYANQSDRGNGKTCAAYADFREMLDKEKSVDAVKIITPDHSHATLAIAAMKAGKNVVMHKPIANRMNEGRLVLETAREMKVGTHLLAYGSGAANGLIVQRIKQGVIGKLKEIHNWTNRPVWPQYTHVPTDTPATPKGFDWKLWLGPERDRPYHPHYTHTVYRGWYDFGGGSMADMGNYSLWPVFTGLELDAPVSAQAFASHTCEIVDHVSRTVKNEAAYPHACMMRFQYAAKGNRPPIELFWYDGGMKPRLPAEVEAHDAKMNREGILFVGEQGSILASFHGRNPQLFADGKVEPLALPAAPDEDHRRNAWLAAMRGEASPGSFLHAGPITDTFNLGTVALRAKQRVMFDSDNMTTDVKAANQFLFRDYRPGWEL
jgi:predicted dehydrogenase